MKSKEKIKYFAVIGLFIFLLVNLVSAQSESAVWQQYGGELTKITHTQNTNSYSTIDTTNFTLISTNIGQPYDVLRPIQPLITDFLDGGFTRLVVIHYSNYLAFLDENLNLVSELDTTYKLLGQMQIGDFNNDGLNNEIAGLYRINNTNVDFRIYQYNITTDAITLLNSTEYAETFTINSTGVRCVGGSNSFCAFQLGNYTNISTIQQYFNGNVNIGNSMGGAYGFEVIALEDINNDGFYEGLTHNSVTDTATIWNMTSGLPIRTFNTTDTMKSARFIRIDNTNLYRIATLEITSSTLFQLKVYRIDGSLIYSVGNEVFNGGFACAGSFGSSGMAVYDYDGDGKDDLYVTTSCNSADGLKIVRGYDGSLLYQSSGLDLVRTQTFTGTQNFILARMTFNTQPSLIYFHNQNLSIFTNINQTSQRYENQISTSGSYMGCASGDLNFDSYNDIVCTNSDTTIALLSNSSNQNAEITSVAYSPSTNIQVGQSVNALITCTDPENDPRYYSIKCSDDLNFSTETFSSGQSCTYSTIGIYTMTLRCRDIYHSDYSTTTQSISVTNTGLTCNNNGICDSGETNVNCPNDCFTSSVDYSQADGGIAIPTQLVDVEGNTETGLLPEIYYGTIAFLSNVLQPMIILIFVIFFVLIMFAIGTLIKKLANKVGG